MLLGRCCRCKTVEPVTIKGLTASTGVTEWEYGPGALWAQHYGADRISGVVNEWTTNDKFVLAGGLGYFAGTPGVRSSGALTANCAQCLKLVKLNSTDGSEVESATMQGVFAYAQVGTGAFQAVNLTRLTAPVGLSGGDYLVPHSMDPAVEWVDYTTDTANKEYILHRHTLQGGNVYIRTKTSNETITIPYNATAAVVKTLFENTADCTAATVTGGPWPDAAINVDVTWSQSTGDISGIKFDATYSAGGSGSCTFQWNAGTSTWVLVSDTCNPGPAEEPLTSGTYDGELRSGTCPVSFPPPPTGTRDTRAAAVSWSTSTGAITSHVGRIFGLGSSSVPGKLIAETAGTVPTVSTLSTSDIEPDLYAGASNSVLVFGFQGTNGRTVEGWTVGSPWSRIWQKYVNADIWAGRWAWAAGLAQSGKVAVCVRRRIYNTSEKAGTIADIAAGTFTEFDESEISTTATLDNNAAFSRLLDGSGTDRLAYYYERRFIPTTSPTATKEYSLGGSEYKTPTKKLLIGVYGWQLLGVDADRIYGPLITFSQDTTPILWSNSNNTQGPTAGGVAFAGSISRTYRWRWYTGPSERYNAGEFRILFRPQAGTGLANKTTSWLDWQCSGTDIVNAVLALFPENTEGVVSNVRVNPLGATNVTDNSPAISLFEGNIDIHFQAAGSLGFIDPRYVSTGRVSIEVRSRSTFPSTGGLAAYSATDASVVWSRNYGSTASPAKTYPSPQGGWLRGSRLYVYGPVVDNELP
ncbi:MAG TPA: hypothetical protein DC058_14170 [Planctomycetaceae bacterium]|nr:hypothetical protein [Planctomycetaceae bacterium]HBC62344.1 hypothetical protein [Planctomycetaceae bacterium]